MTDASYCTLCGCMDSLWYALLECSMSRCVWALAKEEMVEHMIGTTDSHVKQWLFTLKSSLLHVDFTRMAVTLWAIWTAPKGYLRERVPISPVHTYVHSKFHH